MVVVEPDGKRRMKAAYKRVTRRWAVRTPEIIMQEKEEEELAKKAAAARVSARRKERKAKAMGRLPVKRKMLPHGNI